MLKPGQSALFRPGGRAIGGFSGTRSLCPDTVAQTCLTGRQDFSPGCNGSRRFSGIVKDEMVKGFPGEMLQEIADGVEIITPAPGSSKKKPSLFLRNICIT